jgi:hypothetical protein
MIHMYIQILIYLLPYLSQGNNMYGEILGPEMETKMHSYRRMASTFSAVSEFQMQNRVIDLLTPAVWLNLHRAQRSLLFSCAGDTRNFLSEFRHPLCSFHFCFFT